MCRAVMEFKGLLLQIYVSLTKCLFNRPDYSERLSQETIQEEAHSKQEAQCVQTLETRTPHFCPPKMIQGVLIMSETMYPGAYFATSP